MNKEMPVSANKLPTTDPVCQFEVTMLSFKISVILHSMSQKRVEFTIFPIKI